MFYYLFAGLNPALRKEYALGAPSTFRYLGARPDEEAGITSLANKTKFDEVIEILRLMGFEHDDVSALLRILAAVLHLGQIEFAPADGADSCVVTSAPAVSETVARLLQINDAELVSSFTQLSVEAGGL